MSVSSVETKTFTVQELQIISTVLNSDDGRGHSIKDFRLVQGVVNRVKDLTPHAPEQVQAKFTDPNKPTPEELTLYRKSADDFQTAMKTYLDATVEVALADSEYIVVKSRLLNFSQFRNDPQLRERVITLAEKLGL